MSERKRIQGREGVSTYRVQGTGTQPERSCLQCVFCQCDLTLWATTLASGFPVLGQCANQPETPGLMRPVPGRPCRNFRAISRPDVKLPEPPDETVRYIPLTRGLIAIVDARNFEWLNQYKWYASKLKRGGMIYAQRRTPRGHIMMHREIMQTPKGMVCDHADGNGLHNREENLRNCNQSQNMQNCRPREKKAGSKFKGVHPQGDKFKAQVRKNGHDHRLGLFDDPVEAAKARDRKALELFGQFAWLNFPELREEYQWELNHRDTEVEDSPKAGHGEEGFRH